MLDNNSLHQKPENTWWPGIAIWGIAFLTVWINQFLAIALGLMLLFINWLQMGRIKKVIVLAILSPLLVIFLVFTDYGNSTIQILNQPSIVFYLGQIAVILLVFAILVYIGGKDVRKFRQEAQSPKQISKWMGIIIVTSLIVAYYAVLLGLNYFSQKLGYCQFPTLFDLMAYRSETDVDGLEKLLIQRKDLGCGWEWRDVNETVLNFTFTGVHKVLLGSDENTDVYYIEQIIADKAAYTTWSDTNLSFFNGDPLNIELHKFPQAEFQQSKCVSGGVFYECAVVIGFEHLVYGLDVRGVVFHETNSFETNINAILAKAVERILEYEATLP